MPVPAPIDTTMVMFFDGIALRLSRRVQSPASQAQAQATTPRDSNQSHSHPPRSRALIGAFANNSDCRLQLRWAALREQDALRWRQSRIICMQDKRDSLSERFENPMQSEKEKVALGSIAASGGLTLAKGVVGVLTGSLAILSEAAHSLIDFGATVMTYFAVRISGKPADEEHHYGHGKVESVSALAETALLFVLSGVVIWEAAKRLLGDQGHVVEATIAAFAVIVVFDRGRFLPRPPALSRGQRNRERGAGGRRAAFRLRHVVVDRGAGRARRRRVRLPMGGFGRGPRRCGVRLHRRLAARPPHHRDADRHRAGGLRRNRPARRRPRPRRGRGRWRAGAAGRRQAVRRGGGGGQPHAAARPRQGAEGAGRRGDPRRDAARRGRRRCRPARARRRDRAGARHGDRAQPGARRAPRHRARHPRQAFRLARSRGRPQACARRGPRHRRQAGGGAPRGARARTSRSKPTSSRCSRRRPPAARRRRSACARSRWRSPRSPPKAA